MKDRFNDPSHHERTLLPRSYISFLCCNAAECCVRVVIRRHGDRAHSGQGVAAVVAAALQIRTDPPCNMVRRFSPHRRYPVRLLCRPTTLKDFRVRVQATCAVIIIIISSSSRSSSSSSSSSSNSSSSTSGGGSSSSGGSRLVVVMAVC